MLLFFFFAFFSAKHFEVSHLIDWMALICTWKFRGDIWKTSLLLLRALLQWIQTQNKKAAVGKAFIRSWSILKCISFVIKQKKGYTGTRQTCLVNRRKCIFVLFTYIHTSLHFIGCKKAGIVLCLVMLLYTQKNLQEFMGACFKIHVVQFTTVVLVLLKETLLILTKKSLIGLQLESLDCIVLISKTTLGALFLTFINSVLHHRAAWF